MGPSSARRIYHSGRGMPSASSTSTERLRRELNFAYQYLLRLSQGSRTGIVGGLISRLRVPSRRSDAGDRGMGGPTVGGAHTGR
jgi:hypothetical protein